ncbi:hypothetical protein PRIC2_009444 [Phytophthora ramorum]
MDDPLVSGGFMLLICLGVTVVMQCSFFVVAYTCQFDKVTDLAGALNFIVLAVLSLVLQGVYDTRAIVTTSLQVAWALRLGCFLFVRVLKRGKDARFDEMRANCTAFFGFWVFQILWVFLVSLPTVLANSSGEREDSSFGEPRDIVGVVLWAVGLAVEVAADTSKSAFNDELANKGKLLRSGVWKYSRHPNYFGEMPHLHLPGAHVPLGRATAEDRYDERFGLDPDYVEYKRSTSPLVLFPPALYRSIPDPIKRWCFFELDRYSRKLRELRDTEHKTNYQAIP